MIQGKQHIVRALFGHQAGPWTVRPRIKQVWMLQLGVETLLHKLVPADLTSSSECCNSFLAGDSRSRYENIAEKSSLLPRQTDRQTACLPQAELFISSF